jgi:hypothetical protein
MTKGESQMKRNYTTPKAELVKFDYNDQVVVASGAVGTYGSAAGIDRCQQSSTSCSLFYSGSGCKQQPG